PVYVSWARRNRSAMVRVPMYKPGKANATRIEFRAPDPACNPYLAFAVQIAAGLEGVTKKYPLADPIEQDIFEMDEHAREEAGISSLPGNLFEAIQEVSRSSLVREALGDHIFEKFIENKKREWDNFRIHVSKYEIDTYLALL
ncbi:MAG TPA: glutamine synthetase, partial [Deltaproteobacteria bacterium]|nr:glutamine synthetase [Deltaproteobacteria bacterium]